MSLGSPNTFDCCDDMPDATLDPEWRVLIRQQVRTLTAMLQRIHTTAAGVQRHTDALALQTVAEDVERLLAAQAHQHVRLERGLTQLQVLGTDGSQAPAELICTVSSSRPTSTLLTTRSRWRCTHTGR
jgi:hypothetical protein